MTPKPEECEVCRLPRGGPGEAGKCWGGTAACFQRGYQLRGTEIAVLRAQLEDCAKERDEARGALREREQVLIAVADAFSEEDCEVCGNKYEQSPSDEQCATHHHAVLQAVLIAKMPAALARAEGVGGEPEAAKPVLAPDECPACHVRGLSRDRLGGACHALECPDPMAWLRARQPPTNKEGT